MTDQAYLVTCEGQYYTGDKSKNGFGRYSVTVELGDEEKKAGFLSVIKREVLSRTNVMQKQYPDWVKFRTHYISNAVNKNKNAPLNDLSLMNRAQIVAYINKKGLPIEPDLYLEVTDLRQAMKDYKTDKESFEKVQETRRTNYGPKMSIARNVLALNPWLANVELAPPLNTMAADAPVVNHGIDAFDDDDDLAALVGV